MSKAQIISSSVAIWECLTDSKLRRVHPSEVTLGKKLYLCQLNDGTYRHI